MISRIINFALTQRVLVLIIGAAILAWGAYSFTQLPIEAYPDVMNTQVQVIAQWPGHAAEEVEQQISVPAETALNGVPHVLSLRSRSLFGLSVIYLTFDDGIDDYFARDQVNIALSSVTLPTGVQAQMSPMASATGEIYRYTIVGAPVMKLKEIEETGPSEKSSRAFPALPMSTASAEPRSSIRSSSTPPSCGNTTSP